MPKFDYMSAEGKTEERFFPITQDPPRELVIEGETYVRVFAAPPVHYHGSGFYTTDNADSITRWQREHMRHD